MRKRTKEENMFKLKVTNVNKSLSTGSAMPGMSSVAPSSPVTTVNLSLVGEGSLETATGNLTITVQGNTDDFQLGDVFDVTKPE